MANPDALNSLTALSPLDERYRTKVAQLSEYFSEYGLMRERIRVELAWLDALADEPGITEIAPFACAARKALDDAYGNFGVGDADTRKDQRRGRQLQRASGRLSERGLGVVGEARGRKARARVQRVHYADRAARWHCGAVRRSCAREHDRHRPRPRHLGVCFARI